MGLRELVEGPQHRVIFIYVHRFDAWHRTRRDPHHRWIQPLQQFRNERWWGRLGKGRIIFQISAYLDNPDRGAGAKIALAVAIGLNEDTIWYGEDASEDAPHSPVPRGGAV